MTGKLRAVLRHVPTCKTWSPELQWPPENPTLGANRRCFAHSLFRFDLAASGHPAAAPGLVSREEGPQSGSAKEEASAAVALRALCCLCRTGVKMVKYSSHRCLCRRRDNLAANRPTTGTSRREGSLARDASPERFANFLPCRPGAAPRPAPARRAEGSANRPPVGPPWRRAVSRCSATTPLPSGEHGCLPAGRPIPPHGGNSSPQETPLHWGGPITEPGLCPTGPCPAHRTPRRGVERLSGLAKLGKTCDVCTAGPRLHEHSNTAGPGNNAPNFRKPLAPKKKAQEACNHAMCATTYHDLTAGFWSCSKAADAPRASSCPKSGYSGCAQARAAIARSLADIFHFLMALMALLRSEPRRPFGVCVRFSTASITRFFDILDLNDQATSYRAITSSAD